MSSFLASQQPTAPTAHHTKTALRSPTVPQPRTKIIPLNRDIFALPEGILNIRFTIPATVNTTSLLPLPNSTSPISTILNELSPEPNHPTPHLGLSCNVSWRHD